MMPQHVRLFSALTCLYLSGSSYGQILNPVITGDSMLCPEGTGSLMTTQTFDTYQWYRRYFGSATTDPIVGATEQFLPMDAFNYSASYISVEVTQGVVTEMSEEFFVDGWAFLPPVVMTEGDFEIGQNGETLLCEGDTLYLNLLPPYTTEIVWTLDGTPIENETSPVLAVTSPGEYNVSGAPEVCPGYIQQPGVYLMVNVINCDTTAGINQNESPQTNIHPNPVTDELKIVHSSGTITTILIHNASGELVKMISPDKLSVTVPVSDLPKGIYFVTITTVNSNEVKTVSIQ